MHQPHIEMFDPFDLPEWVGDGAVVWRSDDSTDSAPGIIGHVTSPIGESMRVDLLAVDVAAPRPSFPEDERTHAHAAWKRGQVQLYLVDDVVTCAVPTVAFTADLVCDAIRRLAKGVGAPASRFSVLLEL